MKRIFAWRKRKRTCIPRTSEWSIEHCNPHHAPCTCPSKFPNSPHLRTRSVARPHKSSSNSPNPIAPRRNSPPPAAPLPASGRPRGCGSAAPRRRRLQEGNLSSLSALPGPPDSGIRSYNSLGDFRSCRPNGGRLAFVGNFIRD